LFVFLFFFFLSFYFLQGCVHFLTGTRSFHSWRIRLQKRSSFHSCKKEKEKRRKKIYINTTTRRKKKRVDETCWMLYVGRYWAREGSWRAFMAIALAIQLRWWRTRPGPYLQT
jgi:hypothetical protein